MIFVTNAKGVAIYVSDEWTRLTGLTSAQTSQQDWATIIHPADLPVVRKVVLRATRDQQPFNVQYRLRCRLGGYVWISAGACPSFGPPDRCFLGFMGSMAVLDSAEVSDDRASGSIGSYAPDLSRTAHSDLEAVADRLIALHAALTEIGASRLKGSLGLIEALMFEVGKELAQGIRRSTDRDAYQ